MTANQIALILGAGPRVGASVAEKFLSKGYKVATVSRNGTGSKDANGILSLRADFAKPDTIPAVFDAVKAGFGTAPNVVVYNAASLTPPPENDSVLSVPAESFTSDLAVNAISPYVAAQQSLAAWETLPQDVKKTFIYTGNGLNTTVAPVPVFLTLGVGKSAAAYWVGTADALYGAKGYRFFYADERYPDGKFKANALDGPAHAEFFEQLASHEGKVPWLATFVKDQGYVEFK